MPGLAFDDDLDVDPTTCVGPTFREWVDLLAARKSPATVAGYVSDAAVFSAALLNVLGRTVTDELAAEAAVAPGAEGDLIPRHLVRNGVPVVPVRSYLRASAFIDELSLRDLHPRHCARALDDLGATRAAASQRRIASAWSSLCTLLVRRGLLAANPMDHDSVSRPRRPSARPAPIDYDDAQRLLATILSADSHARDPWPARDFALAATLLSGGLRVSEACSVRVSDVQALGVNPRLRVLGKGQKTRVLPLHPDTVAALQTYLNERAERHGRTDPTSALFVRADGSAFTPRAMRRLVDRWYLRAAVHRAPGACVHALRHTFATSALDSGASVVEIQTLLGHASLDTTKVYLGVVGHGLERTIGTHPMGAMVGAAAHDATPGT